MERAGGVKGRYHVLMGVISPLDGVEPEDLTVAKLIERVKTGDVKEVILALNPNMAGEGTSLYLAQVLKPLGVRVTQLGARPSPWAVISNTGDEMTLTRSLEGRREM